MDATDEAIPPPTDAAADALARILFQLQQAFAARGGGLSLARLSKRCALRMSTLRRYLAALEQGGFITLEIAESGIGSAALTAAGVAACADLPPPSQSDGEGGDKDDDISATS